MRMWLPFSSDGASPELDRKLLADPFAEIARDISERAEELKAMNLNSEDFGAELDKVLGDVEKKVLMKAIDEKLERLPKDELMALYAKRIGDEDIDKLLKERALREKRTYLVKEQYAQTGEVDLSKTEAGDRVQLWLPEDGIEGASFFERELTLRNRELDGGMPVFQVLNDRAERTVKFSPAEAAHDSFKTNELIKLGTLIKKADEEYLDPRINLGTSLYYSKLETGQARPVVFTHRVLGRLAIADTFIDPQ
jgi:hypothetical protein